MGLKLGLKQEEVGMVANFPKVSPKSLRLLQMGVGTKYLNVAKQTKEVCIWKLTPCEAQPWNTIREDSKIDVNKQHTFSHRSNLKLYHTCHKVGFHASFQQFCDNLYHA
jgi:hypothetical protein